MGGGAGVGGGGGGGGIKIGGVEEPGGGNEVYDH